MGLTLLQQPDDIRQSVSYDDTFGYEIASHRAEVRLPMASTTKLMTALLVVENTDPDDVARVAKLAKTSASGAEPVGDSVE